MERFNCHERRIGGISHIEKCFLFNILFDALIFDELSLCAFKHTLNVTTSGYIKMFMYNVKQRRSKMTLIKV